MPIILWNGLLALHAKEVSHRDQVQPEVPEDTEGIDMSIFATGKKKPAAPGAEGSTAEATGSKGSAEATSRQDQAAAAKGAAGRLATRVPAREDSSLNPHLKFEGTLTYTGTVTIDCHFKGSVITDDTLIVGPSGRLDAEVTAGVVEISGKVHGNVKALKTVKILKGGEVHGNIETPKISMEEGVVFEGNCSRPADAPQPAAPPAQAARPAQMSPPPAAARVSTSPTVSVPKQPPRVGS